MRISPVSNNSYKKSSPKAKLVANNTFQSNHSPAFKNLVMPFNKGTKEFIEKFASNIGKRVVDLSDSACDIPLSPDSYKYADIGLGFVNVIKGRCHYNNIYTPILDNTDSFEFAARRAQKGLFKNFKEEIFIGKFTMPTRFESGAINHHPHMMIAAKPREERAIAKFFEENSLSHFYTEFVPGRGTIV